MKNIIRYTIILLTTYNITSCTKLTEASNDNQVSIQKLFRDSVGAESAMTGLYAKFMESFSMFNGYLSRYGSLYADELIKSTSGNSTDNKFLNLGLTPEDDIIAEIWSSAYNYIYQANDILDALNTSNSLSETHKSRLSGEAKFLRAFIYFYLVNLYGAVPLVLSTDPDQTFNLPRARETIIYQQIISDLKYAFNNMTLTYPVLIEGPGGRIRANKAAAAALLARISLYTGDFSSAVTYSTWVINCGIYQLEPDLKSVFLSSSRETILAFYPTSILYNTAEGRIFGYNASTSKPSFLLTASLLQSFQKDDKRFSDWVSNITINNITYSIPFKYKVYESGILTEYNVVLRLAEMYLIRAEAYLSLDNLENTTIDLNVIRKRAGKPLLAFSLTKTALFSILEQEKQIEFFSEWAHRWLDIRRWPAYSTSNPDTTRADEIIGTLKKDKWQSYKRYWPIPGQEIKKSSTLEQNTGY